MKSRSGGLTTSLLVTVAFLAAVSPLATDLHLPAFTKIAHDLGTVPSGVQLTLTGFMLGIALGQLFLGPLSDSFGRRKILLIGVGTFALASCVMVFTPTIEVFIALRFLQGMAGAAGIVLGRAIVADLTSGAAAIRAFSLLSMLTAIAPLVAPVAGGLITEYAGWRGVLATLAALTVLMFVLALIKVPESLPLAQRQTGGARRTLSNFGRLLNDRAFVLLAIMVACNFGALLAYVSASPFVTQSILGMSPTQFSLTFATGAVAIILTNFANARMAGRVPPMRLITIGTILVMLAGATFALAAITSALTIPLFIVCAFVLSTGVALVTSNGTALALGLANFARGAGSALLGCLQFIGAAITPPIVGAWGEHTALPMACTLIVGAACACVCALLASRILRRRAQR